MRSNDRSEALDLDRDLPTTRDDVLALRRARSVAPLDLDGYLQFLAQLPEPAAEDPTPKRAPKPGPPFELVR